MLKIAVCDDEKSVCDEVSGLLLRHNADYSVTIFGNGAEFLAATHDFDVVILDIEMPEIDGMTAADRLRRHNKNAYVSFKVIIGANIPINNYEYETSDGVKYNVVLLEDDMYQAYWSHRGDYYTFVIDDRDVIIEIMENLQES